MSAARCVNRLPERELADLIFRWGEERARGASPGQIVEARRRTRITTTAQLAGLVRSVGARAAPRASSIRPRAPSRRLRIHVNRELEGLGAALTALAAAWRPAGASS